MLSAALLDSELPVSAAVVSAAEVSPVDSVEESAFPQPAIKEAIMDAARITPVHFLAFFISKFSFPYPNVSKRKQLFPIIHDLSQESVKLLLISGDYFAVILFRISSI